MRRRGRVHEPPKDVALGLAIARGKLEIIEDIAAGRVPRTVRSFSEMHDYVDANEYAGITLATFDRRLDANDVQNALDRWIKTGMPA